MLDIAGADLSGAQGVVNVISQVLTAARQAGMPVVYLQMGYKADLSDSGGPESPNWHKELGIRLMNCRPELKGKLVTEGTWDFAIVDELTPEPMDIVIVPKRNLDPLALSLSAVAAELTPLFARIKGEFERCQGSRRHT